jgi:hypothetical protein
VNESNHSGDGATDAAFDGDAPDGDGCTVGCGWPEADYYVDARAADGGDGSKLRPFKTITSAIEAYGAGEALPKKAYIAAGTYDAALGEKFPLVLRGLSLQGAGRDATFIVGTGLLDHAAEAGAFFGQYLVTIVAGDRELHTHIWGLSIRSVSPVPAVNYYGVFCDRGSATGEVAPPAGQTKLEQVAVGPGYHASVLATTSTLPAVTGCHISIRSSILTGGWAGLRAYGCDPARLSGPVVVEMGGADVESGNTVSWMQAPNDGAAGAKLEGCVVRGLFQNNAFVDSVYGLHIDDRSGSPVGAHPFTIKGNSFERLTAGGVLALGDGLQIDELSDNRFVSVSRAVTQDPGPRAVALSVGLLRLTRARRNHFIGNDFGVLLSAPGWYPPPGPPAGSFGNIGDPGNNVFRCNSALREPGADFAIVPEPGAPSSDWEGTVRIAGNAWDHSPPTILSVEPMPNGCDIHTLRVPNIRLDYASASVANAECPPNRVPGQ